jgi:Fe-S-cluster containining protein
LDKGFDINWNLSEADFIADVVKIFQQASTDGYRIPTTIQIDRQHPEQIHYYLENILHCEKCDARCCLQPIIGGKANGTIKVDKNDLFHIRQRYGKSMVRKLTPLLTDIGNNSRGFTPPCIYCKNNRCEIYDARPYICRLYPFGVGTGIGEDGSESNILSVDPDCPQAVEYAKMTLLAHYRRDRSQKRHDV